MNGMNKLKKEAQITVFIILAIVIVGGIGIYFAFRQNLFSESVPKQFSEVYDYYISCINAETLYEVKILGKSGGYLESPGFSPGSQYMPFSSNLNFLGEGVPYWFYISGNGVAKEQIPTKDLMQEQLNNFFKKTFYCDFSKFENQGFEISLGKVNDVSTNIQSNFIKVDVNQDVSFKFGNSSWQSSSHTKEVKSNLGKFYDLALKIYNYQKQTLFLENYGVDVLRLYAPVDGTDVTCSPKIWVVDDVRKGLMDALEANVPAIKVKGNYYGLAKEENKYFVQDIGENVDANVNFMYQKNWPSKIDVYPSEDGIMKAEPLGLNEGMGILGFCYVQYHFVYDFAYPVLIQIYYNDELFQFPVVVLIDKNKPREGFDSGALANSVPELCQHKNTKIKVSVFNTNLDSISASISFKCLGTTCDIGTTSLINNESVLEGYFPQCINGFISASADGYKTKKQMISSVNENSFQIVLDRKYKLQLEIPIKSSEYAIVNFIKDNETSTFAYPEQREVELTEGQYEIKVYVYGDSEINFPADSSQKCVDVPKSGLLGVFGFNEQKCFAMDIPEQVISSAISGGGKTNYYIAESQLQESEKIIIMPEDFGVPSKVEDLQANYNQIDSSNLDISFE